MLSTPCTASCGWRPTVAHTPSCAAAVAMAVRLCSASVPTVISRVTPAAQAATGTSATNRVCQATPRSSSAKQGAKATRRRLRLSGSANDGSCATAKMAKVQVAVSRRQGRRCRFVSAKGRLTRARACSKPVYLRARTRYTRSATIWTLSKRVRLPKGSYTAQVRATDTAGHVEKRPRTRRLRVG